MNIPKVRLLTQDVIMVLLYFSCIYLLFFCIIFFTSFEVGQIFLGKRPSFGLIPDLPPIHPNSPRSGLLSNSNSGQPRRPDRPDRTSTQNSVPSSPILGTRGGYSPVRDQRMFIASFCRLDVN